MATVWVVIICEMLMAFLFKKMFAASVVFLVMKMMRNTLKTLKMFYEPADWLD